MTTIGVRNGVLPAVIAIRVQLTIGNRIRTHGRALGIPHLYGDSGPGVRHDLAR